MPENPLHVKFREKDISSGKMIKFLQKDKIDLNEQDEAGYTSFHLMFRFAFDSSMVKIMNTYNANYNIKNNFGYTPFHYFCKSKHITYKLVKFALENGANSNVKNIYKETPMHLLLANPKCTIQMIEIIILTGGDPNSLNIYDQNPLYYLSERGAPMGHILKVMTAGGDFYKMDMYGMTAEDAYKRSK